MNQELRIKNIKQNNIIHYSLFIIRKSRGFTLIELLIVVSIIGVLATLLMTNFIGIRQRARDVQRKGDLQQIRSSLEQYRADQGSYPNQFYVLVGGSYPCGGLFTGGSPAITYMQKTPCDPSAGVAYTYLPGSGDTTYSLITCLENVNDSQKDPANAIPPCNSTNWSFTVQNP